MGRKYYIHGSGELRKDGKLYCSICGRELPGNTLKQPFPCTVSHETPFDEDVQISVWNCSPTVYYKDKDVEEWPLTEPEKDRLYDLAVESVEQAGGALNMSGWYPPSEALCKYIAELKQRYEHE
jgi:C4-type Zn-finger protein